MTTTKTLRPDQMEDLVSLMTNERFMLLSDPGTGKTPPVCMYLYWVWAVLHKRSVWVMPKTLLKKNYDELMEWSEFKPGEVHIYDGTRPPDDAKVFLMTFERWRRSWQVLTKLFPDIDAVAADEVQLGYKTDSSKRTQELYASMHRIRRFVPMSGTLIAGRLDSAYPCINVVCPYYYTGHENFMAIHAITDEYDKVLSWVNHERICKILLKHGSSRSFEDVYGKENKVLQIESVDMSAVQRAKYDEFEKNALLELEDRFLDGSQGGVNAIRCRQIMAHPECIKLPIEYDAKGKPTAWKQYNLTGKEPTGKDERLEIHLLDHLENKTQVATFGVFKPEIERIAALSKRLGLRTEIIHGDVLGHKRAEIDEAFRKKWIDHVVATCATAGVGLNWPDLHHMIFASLDYQDDHFFQAYRRAMRGTRAVPLRITVLEYLRSLDQPIMAIVERKSRDAHKVDEKRQAISFRGDNPLLPRPDTLSQAVEQQRQVFGKAETFMRMKNLRPPQRA